MRGMLLLLLALPAFAQEEGCDEGIEVDSEAADEPEPEPTPSPPEPPPPPGPAKPPEPAERPVTLSPESINRAIDRGVAWLKAAQKEDGSWGPCVPSHFYGQEDAPAQDHNSYISGPTSFAIFTLAQCEVPARDPAIKAGLKWLHARFRKAGHTEAFRYSTYESASLILMLTALYAPTQARRPTDNPSKKPAGSRFADDDWEWMHERISHLCVEWKPLAGGSTFRRCQNRNGGWRYWESSGDQDASATQFVLLALREAVRAGYPLTQVAPAVWQEAAAGARSFQLGNGGFRYKGEYPWSAGMTAASVASLLICKEQMILAEQEVPDWVDACVARGLTFLGGILDVERNTYQEGEWKDPPGYHYYHLYGLERAGVLSGKKEFGGKAWYPRGAVYLLAHQQEDGRWEDATCMRPRDVLGTCFALLFLKRATPPPAVTVSGD